MPLDINGYNSVFKSFVAFAQERHDANQVKAVADAHVNRLDGHRVLAVTRSETDEVHKWLRTRDEYRVNDRTRDYFKKAIIGMFGGESKIPDSVKEAMIMDDYNAGKPLTARRILAVKAAIDADGTAKARAAKIRLETFSPEVKAAALGMGYTKAELPKLARAAHFYAEVNNCAEFEALEALTTPGSKANRLLGYGGRFLKSAANFREGLRLLDSFETWYTATKATLDATGKNYQEGMPKTILNANDSYFKPDMQRGMEKFIFEEIASNASLDLAEQDPEKVFGMENNAATRFFGRGLSWSFTQTVANIPPAKRAAFYAALDTAFPLVTDVAIARLPLFRRPGDQISTINKGIVLARVMKNLDKLAALVAKGGLTVKAFVKICFPEAREKTLGAVGALLKRWNAEIRGGADIEAKYPAEHSERMLALLEETGCSVEEALVAAQGGKQPPIPRYFATGTLQLEAFDGTTRGARSQLAADMDRPANYSIVGGQQNILGEDRGFLCSFPDGSFHKANGSEAGLAAIQTIADKVENLCGAVHREQASSVIMMLSQAGHGNLRGGLVGYGIASNEHAPVDMTLSKDATTGAVTIKYTSPKELPFRFEWTATVDTEGKVTSTPMKFEKPVANLDNATAKKVLGDAAKKLGVKLNKAALAAGATLLAQHGAGMYAKNLAYLAAYIAKSPLAGPKAADAAKRIADLAKSIKDWRDFSFEDKHKMKDLAQTFARRHSAFIEKSLADETKFHIENGQRTPIFETFFQDAHRNTYIINGKFFKKDPSVESGQQRDAVIAAFKRALPEEKAQKALSVLMNQAGPGDVVQLSNHVPCQGRNGVEMLHEQPGANLFVNRNMMSGLYETLLFEPSITFDLKVAEDGRSAVLTITLDTKLEAGDGKRGEGIDSTFGKAQIQERLTLDLTPETPVVTDVAFAQRLR